jgi:hypothetical protein
MDIPLTEIRQTSKSATAARATFTRGVVADRFSKSIIIIDFRGRMVHHGREFETG